MTEPRKRRIVRRVRWALAAILVPPMAYFGGLVFVFFSFGVGWVSDPMVQVYEVPFEWYMDNELPLRHECSYTLYVSNMMGQHFGNYVYRGLTPPEGEPLVQPSSEVIPY